MSKFMVFGDTDIKKQREASKYQQLTLSQFMELTAHLGNSTDVVTHTEMHGYHQIREMYRQGKRIRLVVMDEGPFMNLGKFRERNPHAYRDYLLEFEIWKSNENDSSLPGKKIIKRLVAAQITKITITLNLK